MDLMMNIPQLEYIDISGTGLHGTIPSQVEMSDLRHFEIQNVRNISGTIPAEIGTWKNLGTH
jgi:hypothetical protein